MSILGTKFSPNWAICSKTKNFRHAPNLTLLIMLHRMSFFVAFGLFIGELFLPIFVQAQTTTDTVTYTLADTALANQLFVEMKALFGQRQWEEANLKGDEAYAIYRKVLGEKSKPIADVLNVFGDIAYSQRKVDKAIEWYEKTLEVRLKIFGPENLGVAFSYNSLGASHQSKGEYAQAIGYFQKAMAIYLKLLGNEHPAVADSYSNIGVA